MKKIIVTTTINNPTEAILKFDQMSDFHLLVIGDLKTPKNYKLNNGTYVSPEVQEKKFPRLSNLLGWNCIQRRNIGFLLALEMGADIIATVDDDNIPFENWGSNILINQNISVKSYSANNNIFDPIGLTNYPHLWHRGFPIQLVNSRSYDNWNFVSSSYKVQADFWNGDPDIDAICRMIYKPDCTFAETNFPFTTNGFTPFNSQNTFIARELLPFYFMFPFIGRMDDIWGAYYLQLLTGEKVLFNIPTVKQSRNEHDLTNDFKHEVLGYEKTFDMLENSMINISNFFKFIPEKSFAAYSEYNKLASKYISI